MYGKDWYGAVFDEIISISFCVNPSRFEYVKVRLNVDFSPFLREIMVVSTSTEIGNDFDVSITPILFSAHSLNQILSPAISNPNTCATPQKLFRVCSPVVESMKTQSAHPGFLDGIEYSVRDSFSMLKIPILLEVCSLKIKLLESTAVSYTHLTLPPLYSV